jgi:exocyst complex component 4
LGRRAVSILSLVSWDAHSHYCSGSVNIPKHKPSDTEEDEGEFQEDLDTVQNRNPRLSRFLSHLSSKPNRNPMLNLSDDELVALPAVPTLPNVYLQSLAPSNATKHSSSEDENEIFQTNPEQDSYAYMTMLLESLAILGHLGPALDTISQRISSELFNLVETTIDEVADR